MKPISESWMLEMANVRGKDCKIENINFSFYFSSKERVPHSIRVKVKWNRERMTGSDDGYFKLHGDYEYVSESKTKVSSQDIESARKFFRKYKSVLAGAWEDVFDPADVVHYFENRIELTDLVEESFSEDLAQQILAALSGEETTISQFENVVREMNLFNMND